MSNLKAVKDDIKMLKNTLKESEDLMFKLHMFKSHYPESYQNIFGGAATSTLLANLPDFNESIKKLLEMENEE